MSEREKTVAIVPGSFDPITNGHVDIIRRASAMYGKVYVAVMINSEKSYTFTLEERRRIAEAALRGIDGVEVISSEGYLWRLAKSLGASAIVKGVRNELDREYELKMAEYNSAHYPEAKTILLDTAEGLEGVSSTLLRERLIRGESISDLIPEAALCELERILDTKNN